MELRTTRRSCIKVTEGVSGRGGVPGHATDFPLFSKRTATGPSCGKSIHVPHLRALRGCSLVSSKLLKSQKVGGVSRNPLRYLTYHLYVANKSNCHIPHALKVYVVGWTICRTLSLQKCLPVTSCSRDIMDQTPPTLLLHYIMLTWYYGPDSSHSSPALHHAHMILWTRLLPLFSCVQGTKS